MALWFCVAAHPQITFNENHTPLTALAPSSRAEKRLKTFGPIFGHVSLLAKLGVPLSLYVFLKTEQLGMLSADAPSQRPENSKVCDAPQPPVLLLQPKGVAMPSQGATLLQGSLRLNPM